MPIIQKETTRDILGVPGRAFDVVTWAGNGSPKAPNAIASQRWRSEGRPVDQDAWGKGALMRVEIRFDDNCKNGRPDFAITADIRRPGRRDVEACGCLHDEIREYFPELAGLIPWHLTGAEGPLHYVANTLYHASDREGKARDLDAARRAGVWPDVTDEQLTAPRAILRQELEKRLPALVEQFRREAVAVCGFLWAEGEQA